MGKMGAAICWSSIPFHTVPYVPFHTYRSCSFEFIFHFHLVANQACPMPPQLLLGSLPRKIGAGVARRSPAQRVCNVGARFSCAACVEKLHSQHRAMLLSCRL